MNIPFDKETFQHDMKPLLSMAHLSLEYENIESTIAKVCSELQDKLGKITYQKVTWDAVGLDFLRRAILHFAMYHHIIYTIANISNDGVTVTKSEDKTTIYKYQQDQLEEHLLQDAWFWLNRLIQYMDNNPEDFPEWAESEEKKTLDTLPVTMADFERYVGVSDASFFLFAGWIVREVYREEILSRHANSEAMTNTMRQALCYEVMARACRRLAFHALPSPIRIDINNEMGKNHAAQADTTIREKVAVIFQDKALGYWKAVDAELQRQQSDAAADYGNARALNQNDKFVC